MSLNPPARGSLHDVVLDDEGDAVVSRTIAFLRDDPRTCWRYANGHLSPREVAVAAVLASRPEAERSPCT